MRVRGDAPHDDLCPSNDGSPGPVDCDFCERLYSADARGHTRGWSAGHAEGQRDERERWEAEGPWFKSVVHQCCEDKETAYAKGRAAGLDAARDAVAALVIQDCGVPDCAFHYAPELAAIDALKKTSDE